MSFNSIFMKYKFSIEHSIRVFLSKKDLITVKLIRVRIKSFQQENQVITSVHQELQSRNLIK